jgi:hypothetical protein
VYYYCCVFRDYSVMIIRHYLLSVMYSYKIKCSQFENRA